MRQAALILCTILLLPAICKAQPGDHPEADVIMHEEEKLVNEFVSIPDGVDIEPTPPSVNHGEKAFVEVDTNGDGKITHDELVARMKLIHKQDVASTTAMHNGMDSQNKESAESEAKLIAESQKLEGFKEEFKERDTSKDSKISLAEFSPKVDYGTDLTEADKESLILEEKGRAAADALRFTTSDTNKDKLLDYKEFVYSQLKTMPEVDRLMGAFILPEPEHGDAADMLIEQVDADLDKYISKKEFESSAIIADLLYPAHLEGL